MNDEFDIIKDLFNQGNKSNNYYNDIAYKVEHLKEVAKDLEAVHGIKMSGADESDLYMEDKIVVGKNKKKNNLDTTEDLAYFNGDNILDSKNKTKKYEEQKEASYDIEFNFIDI